MQELNRREGEVIREIGTINKNIAGRTIKEYLEMLIRLKQRRRYIVKKMLIKKEKKQE